jgi:hypothetical protein
MHRRGVSADKLWVIAPQPGCVKLKKSGMEVSSLLLGQTLGKG